MEVNFICKNGLILHLILLKLLNTFFMLVGSVLLFLNCLFIYFVHFIIELFWRSVSYAVTLTKGGELESHLGEI